MMVWIRFWRSLTKKDSVESAKYEIIFSISTPVLGRFFKEPDPYQDFSGSDPEFWPIQIQIRTQEKKSDPDPGKNPDLKHCFQG